MSFIVKLILASLVFIAVAAVSSPGHVLGVHRTGGYGAWAEKSVYDLPPKIDQFVRRRHPQLLRAIVRSLNTQVVAGTNYKINYEVIGVPTRRYEAVVFEQPWTNTLRLTSFQKVYS